MVDKVNNYGERDLALKINEVIDALEESNLSGEAEAQADSVAVDVPALVDDFNDLLAKLRTRGVIAP